MPFSLSTTKAYVEFIGREKARAYLQYIYYKVKLQIQREFSDTIKSRCACVWMYMVDICMVANLILLCSLETYLSFEIWKHLLESRGYLIHLFFFFRWASEYPLFQISQTLVHFFSSLFMNIFCIAHTSSSIIKTFQERHSQELGAFILTNFFLCLILVQEQNIFWGGWKTCFCVLPVSAQQIYVECT